MKNKKYFIFLFLLLIIIPVFVYAAVVTTYGEAVTKTNNYITTFRDRRKYLLFGKNYVYEKTGFGDSSAFINGGLLSKSEFDLSVYSNQSYLANGKEYWTLTSAESNRKYYVDAYIQSKSADSLSGTRVTEYIKPGTIFGGKGTYANPWTFEEGYAVDIISNNTSYGTVSPLGERYVRPGESLQYVLIPANGYYYNTRKDECELIKMGANIYENNYTVENIQRDITCTAVFELKTYIFDLAIKDSDKDYRSTTKTYATQPNPKPVYFKYRTNWYSDYETKHPITSIIKPTITGWTFNGFYYGSVQVIDANGNFTSNAKNLNLGSTNDFRDTNHTLYASITKNTYTITYNLNGGTFGTLHPTSATYDVVVEIDNAKKAGHQFAGWTFNGNTTTAKTGTTANTVTSAFNDKTKNRYFVNLNPTKNSTVQMTANFEACPAGTFNDGTSPDCGQCPPGTYTDSDGQSTCKPCEDGYYCTGGANHTACPRGTEGTGEGKKNEAEGCSQCLEGKYAANEGTPECSTCTAGTYNTTKGNTGCDTCPIGKYCTGGSHNANCPAGTYRNSTGGKKVEDCTTCEDGYYCGGGNDRHGCPTGKEGTGTGKSTEANGCKNCAAGKYADEIGLADCKNCTVNHYSTGGAVTCDACPGSMTCPEQSTSKAACSITCAKGTYLPKGASACSTCTAGNYCEGGTFNFSSTADQGLTKCPGSMTSDAGAQSIGSCSISCERGKYLEANGSTCSTCLASFYCEGGTYNYRNSVQGITQCPGSMISAAGSGTISSCYVTCSGGKFLNANSSTCSTCTAGYYCGGGTYNYKNSIQGRVQCNGDYTSDAGKSSLSECYISCSANTHVASSGENCTSCGSGYSSSSHTVYYGNTSNCTKEETWTATLQTCNKTLTWLSKQNNTNNCVWPGESSAACSSASDIGKVKDYKCTWTKHEYKCKQVWDEDWHVYYQETFIKDYPGLDNCGESVCSSDGGYKYTCTANRTWKECGYRYSLGPKTTRIVDSCVKSSSTPCSQNSHVGNTYIVNCQKN